MTKRQVEQSDIAIESFKKDSKTAIHIGITQIQSIVSQSISEDMAPCSAALPFDQQRVVVVCVGPMVLQRREQLGDVAVACVEQHDHQRVQHHRNEGQHQGVGAACRGRRREGGGVIDSNRLLD